MGNNKGIDFKLRIKECEDQRKATLGKLKKDFILFCLGVFVVSLTAGFATSYFLSLYIKG